MKTTTKYMLERDGVLYETVYNRKYEAEAVGKALVICKWITSFVIVPVKAVWLSV